MENTMSETCWVCGEELTSRNKCPDKNCDSHEGQ